MSRAGIEGCSTPGQLGTVPGGSVASMIRRGTVGAAVLLLLCACASPSSPASSAPPTATATAQQSTTTTTTTAAPKPYTFAISCGGKKYADYKAAWPDNPEMCSADESGGTAISPEQQAAMKAAAEQMEQALVAAQQAAKDGPPSPEVMAPIEEAHAAALDTLKGHAAELRLRTVAAKEAMQE